MKKTAYLAPEMKTFELDMEQTIAYSGGSQATADEPPVVVDPNPDTFLRMTSAMIHLKRLIVCCVEQ